MFKFLQSTTYLCKICGGSKVINKTNWQKANVKIYSQLQADVYMWILTMAVRINIINQINIFKNQINSTFNCINIIKNHGPLFFTKQWANKILT